MNILTIEHLTKAYSEKTLLDEASFSLQEGEKVGVIGINGTGKSTLLKIIAGVEDPDAGEVTMGSNVKIGYLSQTPVFEKNQTIMEVVLEGTLEDPEDFINESEAKAMLTSLGFQDLNQPVGELSGGQKKRVALVAVLLKPVDILVLDEPTNHLDNQMSDWLEKTLIQYRGTLVMVTHDRYFLDRVATRIAEVDQGKIYSCQGGYSKYVEKKEQRLDIELASERKRRSILRTELEWLSRGARARSTKQKAHIQRIEEMQKINAPVTCGQVELSSVTSRMGRKTIEVDSLSKIYGNKVLFRDYSYTFLKGERIGIIGPNGCGKSTFLKIICGDVKPDSGIVEIGQTVKIGYFSQESESLDETMKAIEYVREGAEYIQTSEGQITASALMERFLFDGTMQWTTIGKLSGGEKRRLYLLRILMDAPNVLILDEPTNDLDIQTLTVLEDYLDTFDGIVVVVSHDRYFLDRVVRRILAFEYDGKIQQYEGGYSDYLLAYDLRHPDNGGADAGKQAGAADGTATKRKAEKPKGQQKLRFTFKEQREYETIDDDIALLEEKIAETEEEILKAATDFVKLNELSVRKTGLEQELEEKMERWIYLNELNEKIQAGIRTDEKTQK
ncbi:ABC-F family ATP-binding cassette domain-containing protein [Novisyntrophococcus fermenticellae]|uniref:ABC-F family ATP-binding cassette domain-containing protein n=1 Tax=Novisyntrophococcus fermenticellae TaxID=2068655 RepID=UPI001E4985DF|nr:ABC-F family ATP-binding cassette domain-containing protein [Novisyntrophococcus fermenticellae]